MILRHRRSHRDRRRAPGTGEDGRRHTMGVPPVARVGTTSRSGPSVREPGRASWAVGSRPGPPGRSCSSGTLANRVLRRRSLSTSSALELVDHPPGGRGRLLRRRPQRRAPPRVGHRRGGGDRPVAAAHAGRRRPAGGPRHETAIPLSVRLTCVPGAGERAAPRGDQPAPRGRRHDVTRRVDLRPTAPLLDVARRCARCGRTCAITRSPGPVLRLRRIPSTTAPNRAPRVTAR